MHISSLTVNKLRNINKLDFSPSPRVNIIHGENGSGKTSLLEGIYLLSMGRSFRTHNSRRMIRDNSEGLSVFGIIDNGVASTIPIGVERKVKGELKVQIAGDRARVSDSASLLPVIILNHDTLSIFSGGPKLRRAFLDFGLFHVKQKFITFWRENQRALKQRNAAIKRGASKTEIQSWDVALIRTTEVITEMRREYADVFISRFLAILQDVANINNLELFFNQGWSNDIAYKDLIKTNITRDIDLGYTYYGCHRADLHVNIENRPAHEFLSRGEQKLVVWAMKLTQGLLLSELCNKSGIYLIDDLPSELDPERRDIIGSLLKTSLFQVFITGIEGEDLVFLVDDSTKMFHMKHGELSPVNID